MTRMRVAVVGMGAISRFYLDAIASTEDLDLVACCDIDATRMAQVPDGVARFTSHDELLRTADVEAVFLCLPNGIHHPVIEAALDSGRHVCCEKPLTIAADDARRCQQLADDAGLTLFTAFHRRYNRHFDALRAAVDAADAPVARVRLTYWEDIREHSGGEEWYLDVASSGGGCLIDNGPNVLDLALELCPGPFDVRSVQTSPWPGEIEFDAEVALVSADGATVELSLDWRSRKETKTVEVWLIDGAFLRCDLLEGYPEFKSSLTHEYQGICRDFMATVDGLPVAERGVAISEIIADCYAWAS